MYARNHWAVGRIEYPGETEDGYLLYLKSSISGDEEELIRQYKHQSPTFPHETIADQFFGEGQFEAYRSLGQHIAEEALQDGGFTSYGTARMTFAQFEEWIHTLYLSHSGANPEPEDLPIPQEAA